MELLLLCLLGAVGTWAIVDIVKDDDEPHDVEEPSGEEPTEEDPSLQPPPPDGSTGPGTSTETGLDLLVEENGRVVGTALDDRVTVASDPDADPDAPSYQFEGTVNTHDGDDTISGRFANATLKGGAGDDDISGYFDLSELNADNGNDTITGVLNDSAAYGGLGYDSFDVRMTNSSAYGGNGSDTMTGWLSGSLAHGNAGNDHLNFDGENATLKGGLGNDVIDATGLQNSEIYGGRGYDHITVRSFFSDEGHSNAVYGGDGNDTLRAETSYSDLLRVNSLNGGNGADIFDVALDLPSTTIETVNGQPMLSSIAVVIEDFKPGEDQLRLEMNGPHTEITLTEVAGIGTEVNVHFMAHAMEAEDDTPMVPHVNKIILEGVTGVTMEDLDIHPYVPPTVTA